MKVLQGSSEIQPILSLKRQKIRRYSVIIERVMVLSSTSKDDGINTTQTNRKRKQQYGSNNMEATTIEASARIDFT